MRQERLKDIKPKIAFIEQVGRDLNVHFCHLGEYQTPMLLVVQSPKHDSQCLQLSTIIFDQANLGEQLHLVYEGPFVGVASSPVKFIYMSSLLPFYKQVIPVIDSIEERRPHRWIQDVDNIKTEAEKSGNN